MIDSVLFIGTVIIAITEVIKYLAPNVRGAITIGVAALVGIVVSLIDVYVGIGDISIAQGLMTGLGAAGVTAVAAKVNSGATASK